MIKHTKIPSEDGFYWYFESEKQARLIQIDQARYGNKFKSFDNSMQGWVKPDEYFFGPITPPAGETNEPLEVIRAISEPLRSMSTQLTNAQTNIQETHPEVASSLANIQTQLTRITELAYGALADDTTQTLGKLIQADLREFVKTNLGPT